jgi:hypothetical protein
MVRPRGRHVQRRVDVACGADGSHTEQRTDAPVVVSATRITGRELAASRAPARRCQNNATSRAERDGRAEPRENRSARFPAAPGARLAPRAVAGQGQPCARGLGDRCPGGGCASRPPRLGGAMRPGRCVSAKTAPEARPAAQARFRRGPAGDPVAQPMAHRPADHPSRRGHRPGHRRRCSFPAVGRGAADPTWRRREGTREPDTSQPPTPHSRCRPEILGRELWELGVGSWELGNCELALSELWD